MPEPLSPLEKKILDRIQWDFPLSEDPYAEIAAAVGSTSGEVGAAIEHLRQSGVIRRIGGSFAPGRLGYVSVLVAARVEPNHITAAAATVSAFPEVTHNYERDGLYNLWFTVVAESAERIDEILRRVKACNGVLSIHALPALRTFKLRVDFRFDDEREAEEAVPSRQSAAPMLDEIDRRIIARASGDLPRSPHPFLDMAHELAVGEDELLARLRSYRESGVLRRLGAILRHQLAGFVANGMSVWRVPPQEVERIGELMAACPEISHCYERPALPDWPYSVYAMIHGRSKEECLAVASRLSRDTSIREYRVLFSLREFKKTSRQYGVELD